MRVRTLDLGILNYGNYSGVIWLRFMLREADKVAPSDSDIVITAGKENLKMNKSTV